MGFVLLIADEQEVVRKKLMMYFFIVRPTMMDVMIVSGSTVLLRVQNVLVLSNELHPAVFVRRDIRSFLDDVCKKKLRVLPRDDMQEVDMFLIRKI